MNLSIFKGLRRGRQSEDTADNSKTATKSPSEGYKQVDSRDKAPDWLKDDSEESNIQKTPGWLKVEEGDEKSPESQQFDQEDDNARDIADEDDTTPPRRRCYSIRAILCIVSCILFALFVYSTIVQYNDPDKIQWFIYYGFQAAIPILFLVHYIRCNSIRLLVRSIYILSGVMIVWSMVYISLISHDLKKHTQQDDPDEDTMEEYIFELLGVLLGFLSALYHSIVTCCFARRRQREEST